MKLFFHAARLRLTMPANAEHGERTYLEVKLSWAAPQSRPGQYLALLDNKDKEIALLENPAQELDAASWTAAQDELRARYLTARVAKVLSAREEYGATYWSVESDRGAREFVTQNLQENAQWLSPDQLLILDVDGNRFEIASIQALDEKSRAIIGDTV